MPDNVGPYITTSQLLIGMARAELAQSSKITLSNKSVNQFDFTPNDPAPEIGDWIVQDTEAQVISSVSGSQLQVEDGTNLTESVSKLIKTTLLPNELTGFIKESMDFIDLHTGQFFNKREFTESDPFVFEGNNADTIFLRVPIIEVQKIFLNDRNDELASDFFRVFSGRRLPQDDRRNPMIKLLYEPDDVLFNEVALFMRGKFTRIVGSFGFLEADGSTPSRIQKATERYAVLRILTETTQLSGGVSLDQSRGPIKREKTDLHEIEYFKPTEGKELAGGNGPSGDDFVDVVISDYRAATTIGGSYPDIYHEQPRFNSFGRGN